jgi:hypothetical protein
VYAYDWMVTGEEVVVCVASCTNRLCESYEYFVLVVFGYAIAVRLPPASYVTLVILPSGSGTRFGLSDASYPVVVVSDCVPIFAVRLVRSPCASYPYSSARPSGYVNCVRRRRASYAYVVVPRASVAVARGLEHLRRDIAYLLLPSRDRALALDRAYRAIVEEQSFDKGREPVLTISQNVYSAVPVGSSTGHRSTSCLLRAGVGPRLIEGGSHRSPPGALR